MSSSRLNTGKNVINNELQKEILQLRELCAGKKQSSAMLKTIEDLSIAFSRVEIKVQQDLLKVIQESVRVVKERDQLIKDIHNAPRDLYGFITLFESFKIREIALEERYDKINKISLLPLQQYQGIEVITDLLSQLNDNFLHATEQIVAEKIVKSDPFFVFEGRAKVKFPNEVKIKQLIDFLTISKKNGIQFVITTKHDPVKFFIDQMINNYKQYNSNSQMLDELFKICKPYLTDQVAIIFQEIIIVLKNPNQFNFDQIEGKIKSLQTLFPTKVDAFFELVRRYPNLYGALLSDSEKRDELKLKIQKKEIPSLIGIREKYLKRASQIINLLKVVLEKKDINFSQLAKLPKVEGNRVISWEEVTNYATWLFLYGNYSVKKKDLFQSMVEDDRLDKDETVREKINFQFEELKKSINKFFKEDWLERKFNTDQERQAYIKLVSQFGTIENKILCAVAELKHILLARDASGDKKALATLDMFLKFFANEREKQRFISIIMNKLNLEFSRPSKDKMQQFVCYFSMLLSCQDAAWKKHTLIQDKELMHFWIRWKEKAEVEKLPQSMLDMIDVPLLSHGSAYMLSEYFLAKVNAIDQSTSKSHYSFREKFVEIANVENQFIRKIIEKNVLYSSMKQYNEKLAYDTSPSRMGEEQFKLGVEKGIFRNKNFKKDFLNPVLQESVQYELYKKKMSEWTNKDVVMAITHGNNSQRVHAYRLAIQHATSRGEVDFIISLGTKLDVFDHLIYPGLSLAFESASQSRDFLTLCAYISANRPSSEIERILNDSNLKDVIESDKNGEQETLRSLFKKYSPANLPPSRFKKIFSFINELTFSALLTIEKRYSLDFEKFVISVCQSKHLPEKFTLDDQKLLQENIAKLLDSGDNSIRLLTLNNLLKLLHELKIENQKTHVAVSQVNQLLKFITKNFPKNKLQSKQIEIILTQFKEGEVIDVSDKLNTVFKVLSTRSSVVEDCALRDQQVREFLKDINNNLLTKKHELSSDMQSVLERLQAVYESRKNELLGVYSGVQQLFLPKTIISAKEMVSVVEIKKILNSMLQKKYQEAEEIIRGIKPYRKSMKK